MEPRYIIIVLGTYTKIEQDLNYIANPEYGVHYVDGNGIFIGTFFSPYNTDELSKILSHIPAFLVFDITNEKSNTINLPTKYFKGLFPEYEETLKTLQKSLEPNLRKNKKSKVEEYNNVNDILDKLGRNKYDRNCLTEKEIEILEKGL